MHSCRRFALETVTALQYRCPQSGTSLMHTAFACGTTSSGSRHSGGRRQLRPMPPSVSQVSALPVAPETLVPPIRPVRDLDAFCAGSPRRPSRAGTPPVGTATSAFCAVYSGVRLAYSLWRAEIAGSASHDAGAVPHRAACGWLARRPHCYYFRLNHHNLGAPPLSAPSADRVGLPLVPPRSDRVRVFDCSQQHFQRN